jgi:arsenate reductase
MNVLFLCTGNSARSILAEATFNHLAPAGWTAQSAGSHPKGTVHVLALAVLERNGISGAGLHSKSWEHLPVTPDIVITVCANAAAETCPAHPGPAVRTHWGVDDPACVTGTRAQQAAFETAYRILRGRIEAFLSLPLEALAKDPVRLKAEIDRIASHPANARSAAGNVT